MLRFHLITLIALVSVGCNSDVAPSTRSLPPARVTIQAVELVNMPSFEEVLGNISSELKSRIESKVPGTIKRIAVAVGAKVTRGELLLEIDAKEIAAKLDQALAVERQASAEYQRVSKLIAQQAATKQQFEAAEAQLSLARGALAEARAMMEYTKVVAPFDGSITRKFLEVGDLAAPGKAVLELEKGGGVRVEINVPESLITNVKLGDELTVVVADRQISSVVTEIAPAADTATRTFLIKSDLPAADGLRAGQFCRVLVPVGSKKTILIDAAHIIRRGQLDFVMVAKDGTATLRLIRTARQSDGSTVVLAGLDPGEKIITSGLSELRDGQPLEVQ